jgi:hypothetical protein
VVRAGQSALVSHPVTHLFKDPLTVLQYVPSVGHVSAVVPIAGEHSYTWSSTSHKALTEYVHVWVALLHVAGCPAKGLLHATHSESVSHPAIQLYTLSLSGSPQYSPTVEHVVASSLLQVYAHRPALGIVYRVIAQVGRCVALGRLEGTRRWRNRGTKRIRLATRLAFASPGAVETSAALPRPGTRLADTGTRNGRTNALERGWCASLSQSQITGLARRVGRRARALAGLGDALARDAGVNACTRAVLDWAHGRAGLYASRT